MSRHTDYEPKEWKSLQLLACSGILYKLQSKADLSKYNSISAVVGLLREIFSFGPFLTQSLEKYKDSPLVCDLIANIKEGKSITSEKRPAKMGDLEELVNRVNDILAKKAEVAEAQAYRAFVYELAYAIANASGDGFLGTGTRINAKEAEFLHTLKSLLLNDDSQ